jgi:hypothetical protein
MGSAYPLGSTYDLACPHRFCPQRHVGFAPAATAAVMDPGSSELPSKLVSELLTSIPCPCAIGACLSHDSALVKSLLSIATEYVTTQGKAILAVFALAASV